MSARDSWQRLCALLDDDPELWPTVEAALDDPPADPWTALLDGLDDAGVLAYLDLGDEGSELADALAGIPRVRDARLDLGPVTDTDGDLPVAVRAADRVLGPAGLCLVHLDEGIEGAIDEGYPLVAVRTGDRAEIDRLVAELGHSTTLG